MIVINNRKSCTYTLYKLNRIAFIRFFILCYCYNQSDTAHFDLLKLNFILRMRLIKFYTQ